MCLSYLFQELEDLMMDKKFKLIAEDGRELDISATQIDPNATQLIVVNVEGINQSEELVNRYLDNVYKCITALGVKNFAIIPCVGNAGQISVVYLNK